MRLPGTHGGKLAFDYYSEGEQKAQFTNEEMLEKAADIWRHYLSKGNVNLPVFLTLSLQTPLGFATFLSSISHGRKVFVPSSYNMAQITKSFGYQKSDMLVCDENLYKFEAPEHKAEEIAELKSGFEQILVPTHITSLGFNVYNEF